MSLMNQAWDDAVAFIQRESALLVPLALATVFVADVAGSLVRIAPETRSSVLSSIVSIAAMLWSIVGQLSLTALALKPGSSVAEAIRIGARRLSKTLLVALLLGGAFALALLPVAAAIANSGFNPEIPESIRNAPGWVAIYMAVLSIVIFWVAARLIMLNALIVDRNPGPIHAIRTAYALTRGLAAQILLVLIIYLVVLVIMTSAVRFVVGGLFALIGAAAGSPFLSIVLTALVSGLISASLSMVAAVFIAMLYRRVIPR